MVQADDTLVAAASEVEVGGVERLDERPVDQGVDIGQQRGQGGGGLDFFKRVAGVAPHVEPGLLFDAAQQGQEFFRMAEGVASRESDAVEQGIGVDFPDDFVNLFVGQWRAGLRIPALRVVAARAAMIASGQINGIADAFAVDNRFGISVEEVHLF